MTDTTTVAPISIFDICETDAKAEEDGRWFRDIFNDGSNIDVKLRRLTSRASMRARRNLDKGYRKHMKNGVLPDDLAVKVLIEQLAEAILIDWSGINDRDLKPIPYSKENAIALLTKLTVFREGVIRMADNLDNFRVEDQETTTKN